VVLYQGIPVPAYSKHPVVIGDFGETSAARDGGLAVGDRIVAVGSETVEDWEDFVVAIATKANRQVTLRAERNGAFIERQVTPAAHGRYKLGDIGVVPVLNPQVSGLTQGGAAEAAGLRMGDVVVGAEGERNPSYLRLLELIVASPDNPVTLEVRRDGVIQQIAITPRRLDGTLRIGANFSVEVRESSPGPLEAIKLSAIQNWDWTILIGKTLKGLFTRDTPMNQMMGPLGIAELSGSAAQVGWVSLFTIMAMLSLNLGLFNLMPIPVLDGGHIMILALEGVSRRDFSVQVKQKMVLVGLVLLITLMGTVLFNDLARLEWIQRLMEGPG
jgi:regulator of sigma E protease